MLDLAVVHYHLLPGGVTSVIRDGLRAIIQHRPGLLRSIHLFAGQRDGVDTVVASLRSAVATVGADTDVRATVDQRLDYANVKTETANWRLAESVGPNTIWWLHNHHLGKNVPFTRALLAGALTGSAKVLLQIHDFPESGRLDSYQELRAALGSSLYPFGPDLRYAVISRRDYKILSAAGIPAPFLHLLWNPVAPMPPERPPSEMAATIAGGRKFWLYPVRARRRKNVLEAGLLARIAGHAAVGVTLPAISSSESSYYRKAAALFRNGTLPGQIGLAAQPRFLGHSLAQFAGAADAVVSSSIEEGFGYQYLHAQQWCLPLIARKIEAIEGFHDLLQSPSTVLYDRLDCPIPHAYRMLLSTHYRTRLSAIAPLLPETTLRTINSQIKTVIAGPLVDYSYLSFELQQSVAARCRDPQELRQLRAANSDLFDCIRALPERTPNAIADKELERRFGATAFAKRAAEMLTWEPWTINSGNADADAVLSHFAAAPYQRLLFDPV